MPSGGTGNSTSPSAEWIARRIINAFPWNEAPRYLIRDQDGIYGVAVRRRSAAIGIRDRPIARGWPWQNGFAERLIRSIRRECLDHVIVVGEAHLRRILQTDAGYYNSERTGRWTKMHRFRAPFSGPDQLNHTRSWAASITITSGFRFSVYTPVGKSRVVTLDREDDVLDGPWGRAALLRWRYEVQVLKPGKQLKALLGDDVSKHARRAARPSSR